MIGSFSEKNVIQIYRLKLRDENKALLRERAPGSGERERGEMEGMNLNSAGRRIERGRPEGGAEGKRLHSKKI